MAAGHREAARSVLDGGEHGARLKRAGASAEEMTMRDTSLLQLALGLVPPWAVIRSEFDAEARQLDIRSQISGQRESDPDATAIARSHHRIVRHPIHPAGRDGRDA